MPNPYYSFSQYEVSQVDTRVKITNLPTNTSISIYTADGSLVRRLNKTETAETSLEWDMKNANGVPIASGAYLFYIRCYDNTGKKYERVQKWFCVNRPLDLSTY